MEKHTAKMWTNRALQRTVSPAADVTYGRDDEVLVWRENQVNNGIGKWVRPHLADG